MKASDICKKYDPIEVSMALSMLMSKGMQNFTEEAVKREMSRIDESDLSNTLIAPHIQKQALMCAAELAKLSIFDILRYVQTEFKIDTITTHPGFLLEIRERAINTLLFRGFLPADTTEDTLDELSERLKAARKENDEKLGVVYCDDRRRAINKVLKEMKLTYETDEPDKVILM